jgi:hypothetical protein
VNELKQSGNSGKYGKQKREITKPRKKIDGKAK